MWCLHTREYFSEVNQEGNSGLCYNMDMASSLRVPLLLLAAVVLDLAMTPMALEFHQKSPHLPGGLQDVDINDKGVQQAVDFALREYNNDNKDLNLSRLVQVVRAREQVVGGMNYYLDLEIGRTTCAKEQSTQEECSLSEEPAQLCSFVVHSRAWEDYMAVISTTCHSA
ncbi:PREDICTED: cystatin-C-like isoform X2 [Chinchilla lanigera]|uniref:cystatin-C-like isoform X2 n=1 Tax=Chinchilla lanigera TaxID=34839 RepID=UPI00038F00DF|nr:PREDICTED: cystatin-C-like isoform X2 [Chinchilla lanigera]